MIENAGSKWCLGCETFKLEADFHTKVSSSDGLQTFCKACCKTYSQEAYAGNREAQITSTKARQARNRGIVQPLKIGPCTDCGRAYHPFVMDFDHVRGAKIRSVSQLVARCANPTTILAEIDKCDLVCSNCHRIRTWNRNNPTDLIGYSVLP